MRSYSNTENKSYIFENQPCSLKNGSGLFPKSPRRNVFVAFVEDNATMSSVRYFENHASYFV